MSGKVTGWVLDESAAKGAARMVLVVLADHASSDGTEARPSVPTIMWEGDLSRRAVQSSLRHLEEKGAIKKTGVWGKGESVYTVVMGAHDLRRAPDARAQLTTNGGATDDSEGAQAVRPNRPEINHPEEPSNNAPALFDAGSSEADLWDYYRLHIPDGDQRLTPDRKRELKAALKVRPLEVCKRAVDGVAANSWYRDNGKLALRHVIGRTGGKGVADTIDDRARNAPKQAANGQQKTVITAPENVRELISDALTKVRRGFYGLDAMSRPATTTIEQAHEAKRWLEAHGFEVVIVENRLESWRQAAPWGSWAD